MAERGSNIPIELDEGEIQIITSFDLLIDCLNGRKAQILAEYRERRGEVRAQIYSRDSDKRNDTRPSLTTRSEAFQQLSEAKLDIQNKLKNNELRSTLDKLSSDINFKLNMLELEEAGRNSDKLLFEYNMKDLEIIISQFGKITDNGCLVEPPNGLPYFTLNDNEVNSPGKLGSREGLKGNNSNSLDIQEGDRGKASSLAPGMEDYSYPDFVAPTERMHLIEQGHSADNSMEGKTTLKKFKNVFSNWKSPENLNKKEALPQRNKDNYCEIEILPRCCSNSEKESGEGGRTLESPPKVSKIKKYSKNDWFFGAITRSDAGKKLLTPGYPNGTFLVRESESLPGTYAVSIRKQDSVINYRIQESDSGDFFLKMNKTFKTLEDLVGHYSIYADGLRTKFTVPCPKGAHQIVIEEHQYRDEWEIEKSRLRLKRKLEEGQFAESWEGVWDCKVHIKCLHPGGMSREDIHAGIAIMKKLHHENVIQLYGVCLLGHNITYIVTEYLNESLLSYLQGGAGAKLMEHKMIEIGAKVAAGMAYLERQDCIHRNLAARNVRLGKYSQVKVAEFEFAGCVSEAPPESPEENTVGLKWTAPEVIGYNRFSIKSDVWSFGILLMEIMTLGRDPYPGMSDQQVATEVTTKNYRMPKPPLCHDYLYKIMLYCWNENPDNRPTFEALKYLLNDFYVAAENPFVWIDHTIRIR